MCSYTTTKYYYLDIKSHQKKAVLFQSSPLKYFALSIFCPTKVQCLQRGRCCLWPSNLLRKKEVTIRFLACKPPVFYAMRSAADWRTGTQFAWSWHTWSTGRGSAHKETSTLWQCWCPSEPNAHLASQQCWSPWLQSTHWFNKKL